MAALDSRLFKSLAILFNQSQDSSAAHEKLVLKCQQLYREFEFNVFFETFTNIMQTAMLSMQKNPNVDRCLDFISKFASVASTKPPNINGKESVSTKNNNNNNETMITESNEITNPSMNEEEFENPFITSIIDWLIDNLKANCDAVRYRCCNILSKLMGAISNEQFIDEDLYDRLCDGLLERLKDINSRVQVQAISAIYRLQDPNDKECRVIKALLFLMTYDPNWQVRYQAISNIAFSKTTLPDIIDRVRDPSPFVRRKAIVILSEKVLIKFISIEKRLFILNYSLKDEDPGVLETCCKKLLPSWLAHKENDLCKLLKALDVVDSPDTAELMLNSMYKESSLDSLTNDFVHMLNENHLIPIEKLDPESVFYWSWVCGKCKNIGDKQNQKTEHDTSDIDHENEIDRTVPQNNDKTNQIESEDNLDRLLPSLTEFCEYITKIFKSFDQDRLEKQDDEKFLIETTFIVKQLFKMFLYIDFSDKHGKKTLINFCEQLFSNKNYQFLFESIMKVYKLLIPNLQQRINKLVELISDLKEPAEKEEVIENVQQHIINETFQEATSESGEHTNHATTRASNTEPPRTKLEISLQISELKFQRFKLKDDFDKMYQDMKNVDKQVDMVKVAELRDEIKKCEDEIAKLQIMLSNPQSFETNAPTNCETMSIDTNSHELQNGTHVASGEPIETLNKNKAEEPFDPIERTHHCLELAVCLMEDLEIKTLTPQLRSLFDTLILPNIGSPSEEIRYLSVKSLCLICILKLELAQKYTPLLLEMIQQDKKEVVLMAFKGMINFIMAFSINRLISNEEQIGSEQDEQLIAEAQKKVLTVMWSLIDHDDADVYTTATEGFCKLYMTGHLLSAKMFSKLFIMYYSPLNENDVKLKSILASFLPQFSFLRYNNQLCVEESFMITIKALINAPVDNYLCEIDLNKVIETLLHLTNPKHLLSKKTLNKRQGHNINICHENITKSICMEILKDDNSYKCKTYLKIIQMTDLSEADYLSLKEIHQLANEVHDHIQDKNLKKTAKKFVDTVFAQLSVMPDYLEEQKKQEETDDKMGRATHDETSIINNKTVVAANINNNSTTISIQVTQENEESNSDRLDDSESNRNDSLVDYTFKKLKKKNLLKVNSKKSDKTNILETTETETENESGKDGEAGENAKTNKKSERSLLRSVTSKTIVNNRKSQVESKKEIAKIDSTNESDANASQDEDQNNAKTMNLKRKTQLKNNIVHDKLKVDTSIINTRLSRSTSKNQTTIETIKINDTESETESEGEQVATRLRRSSTKGQEAVSKNSVNKSKSSIKITKINPIKFCSVLLPKLDQSQLSQSNLSVDGIDNSMNEETSQDDEILHEKDVKKKSARCKSQQQPTRTTRQNNTNDAVESNGTHRGRLTATRSSSLNNTNLDNSDNEPPKKLPRSSAESETKIKPSESTKKSTLKVVAARNNPCRASPRNKK